ncbi:MAG: hypothetical protein ACR2QF_09840 [Geminicoccaceae bacterium]
MNDVQSLIQGHRDMTSTPQLRRDKTMTSPENSKNRLEGLIFNTTRQPLLFEMALARHVLCGRFDCQPLTVPANYEEKHKLYKDDA